MPSAEQQEQKHGFVIEIGAFNCEQAVLAAMNHFLVYSLEASPYNYKERCGKYIRNYMRARKRRKYRDNLSVFNLGGGAVNNTVFQMAYVEGMLFVMC